MTRWCGSPVPRIAYFRTVRFIDTVFMFGIRTREALRFARTLDYLGGYPPHATLSQRCHNRYLATLLGLESMSILPTG